MHLLKIINLAGKKFTQELPLDEIWECGEDGNSVKIFPSEEAGACRVLTNKKIRLNGRPFEGQKLLQHNDVLSIEGNHYIYKDEEAEAKRLQKIRQKVKTASQIEREHDKEEIEREAKTKFCNFINTYEPKSQREFLILLIAYLKREFGIERLIFYNPLGTRWKPIIYKLDSKYRPPMKIMRNVYKTGNAVFIQTRELKRDDTSKSIVDNEIKTVFCIPLYTDEHIPFLVVYGDNSIQVITEKDFAVIDCLCEYARKHLINEMIPPLKKIDLEGDNG